MEYIVYVAFDDEEELVRTYSTQELVRCKYCKHWLRRECGTYGTCDNWHLDGFFDADWFCADGVMKDDG